MQTIFSVTERIAWNRMEFTFFGFKELANKLQEFNDLSKLTKNKKYKVIIEEID